MKVPDALVDYAYDFIKKIIETFGDRFSCSKGEREANEWIREELGNWCDETHLEEFQTHPTLYPTGIFKIVGILGGIAFPFMMLAVPWMLISTGVILLALLILYLELWQLKRWIAPLFKKGTSSNVFGILNPTGEVRKTVVFEGHTDAAKQMKLAEYEKLPLTWFVIGILYLVVTLVLPIAKLILVLSSPSSVLFTLGLGPGSTGAIIQWTLLDWIYYLSLAILYPSFIFVVRGFIGYQTVPGASDNLSGSAIAAAIAKYFSENRPKHVKIIVGSMGSEENGDRGAKYFVEQHPDLLENSYAFIMDDVGSGDLFNLVEKDFHTHGKLYSEEVLKRVEQAHERHARDYEDVIPVQRKRLPFGSSDACMYLAAGHDAMFMVSAPLLESSGEKKISKPANWHSMRDNWQSIKKRTLRDAIGMGIEFVKLVDEELSNGA